jgi:hypothetical protein
MNRVPVLVFATIFALIGVIAASSVYVSEKNEVTVKPPSVEPALASRHQ